LLDRTAETFAQSYNQREEPSCPTKTKRKAGSRKQPATLLATTTSNARERSTKLPERPKDVVDDASDKVKDKLDRD
jgi:hypothetical protein